MDVLLDDFTGNGSNSSGDVLTTGSGVDSNIPTFEQWLSDLKMSNNPAFHLDHNKLHDMYLAKYRSNNNVPVSGSKVDVDPTTGRDSDVYGSNDVTGFDQASWALEQQWKLDQAEREFNSAEAAKQRDWEKMMSDTAISRSVQDLKNAGLNPWLALNGGSLGAASTPSGAAASASSGSSKVPHNYLYQLIASLVSSAAGILKSVLSPGTNINYF